MPRSEYDQREHKSARPLAHPFDHQHHLYLYLYLYLCPTGFNTTILLYIHSSSGASCRPPHYHGSLADGSGHTKPDNNTHNYVIIAKQQQHPRHSPFYGGNSENKYTNK